MKRSTFVLSSTLLLATLGVVGTCKYTQPKNKNVQPIKNLHVVINSDTVPVESPTQSSSRKTEVRGPNTYIFTDAYDPQFRSQVLPQARSFFNKLQTLGVSPLEKDIASYQIKGVRFDSPTRGTNNTTNCIFAVVDPRPQENRTNTWQFMYSAMPETAQTKVFDGITFFSATGQDNLEEAISKHDLVTLSNMANRVAWNMPDETSHAFLNNTLKAFAPEGKYYNSPQYIHQQPFGIEIGVVSGSVTLRGSDPRNQLEPRLEVSVAPAKNRKVQVVYFSDSVSGWK